jgi:hypothetical protein
MLLVFNWKRRNERLRFPLLESKRKGSQCAVAISTNTPLFSHTYGAMNLLCPILIANNCTRWRCNFKVPFVICINVLVHTVYCLSWAQSATLFDIFGTEFIDRHCRSSVVGRQEGRSDVIGLSLLNRLCNRLS